MHSHFSYERVDFLKLQSTEVHKFLYEPVHDLKAGIFSLADQANKVINKIFIIWPTLFKYKRSYKQTLLNLRHNARADRLRDVCRKFILTVHNSINLKKLNETN